MSLKRSPFMASFTFGMRKKVCWCQLSTLLYVKTFDTRNKHACFNNDKTTTTGATGRRICGEECVLAMSKHPLAVRTIYCFTNLFAGHSEKKSIWLFTGHTVYTQDKVTYANPPMEINDILTVRPAITPHSKQRHNCSYEPFKYLHKVLHWLQHKTAFQKLNSFFMVSSIKGKNRLFKSARIFPSHKFSFRTRWQT